MKEDRKVILKVLVGSRAHGLACPRCNATKSDYFTYKQMLEIGRIVHENR